VAEKRTRKKQDEAGRCGAAAAGAQRRGRKGRKRIRIFANHSSRHLRVGKSPSPLKSEEVERFIESRDAQSLEDTPESASETSSLTSPSLHPLQSMEDDGLECCIYRSLPRQRRESRESAIGTCNEHVRVKAR